MSYSLNEVEAHSKRAARGAGLGWGLAEEAAKATRWLCAQNIDGCRVLTGVLEAHQDPACNLQAPISLVGEWRAEAGRLCPLYVGASLSDCATLVGSNGVSIRDLSHPLFILPFVAAAARKAKTNLQVRWPGATMTTNGKTVDLAISTEAAFYIEQVEQVEITVAPPLSKDANQIGRARPSNRDWEKLNSFAALTYAPATEASRRLGAGAGQSDND